MLEDEFDLESVVVAPEVQVGRQAEVVAMLSVSPTTQVLNTAPRRAYACRSSCRVCIGQRYLVELCAVPGAAEIKMQSTRPSGWVVRR